MDMKTGVPELSPPTLPQRLVKLFLTRRTGIGKDLGLVLGLATVYFSLGRLGVIFSFMHPGVTPIWPPLGIAVAGLLIFGYRVWPGVFLGALAVELTTPCNLSTSLLLATTNTLESLVGTWLANRFAHGRNFFRHPWDIVKFAVLVGMVSPLFSPPLGVRVLSLDHFILQASNASTDLTWWLGDLVSLLVLTPLAVAWAVPSRRHWPLRQALEFGLLLLLVVAVGEVVFGGAVPASLQGYLRPHLCLPLLFWAAFRFSERETMTVTLLLGGVVMWDTLHGYGAFAQADPNKNLLVYQGFMATASVLSLSLAAVVGQRRRAGEQLGQANRALRMISECNQALVRIADEQKLIQEICRIIIDVGGYKMAWVGFAEPNAAKTVRLVTSAGYEKDYLDKIQVSWADDPFGQGPTGMAIRTGTISLGRDFLSEPRLAPWRELALEHGLRSSVALPLVVEGRVFGALTIYAAKPEAFDQKQLAILTELAKDMAFGITAARAHAERDHVRKTLEQKAAQLRALSTELVHAEARERRRLAQTLHDSLQQLLVGARYNIELLRKQSKGQDSQESCLRIDGFLAQCIQISRSLTAELSPPILYEAGIASALRWLGRWFQETHGLTVRVTAQDELLAEPEDVRVTLFQAVRELLFNIVKHAQVKQAEVSLALTQDRRVRITVSDQGAGFDPARLRARPAKTGGLGLFSLRERFESLGGELAVESAPGRGSRFTLTLPLDSQSLRMADGEPQPI